MKKWYLLVPVLAMVMVSCLKDPNIKCEATTPTAMAPANETAMLQNYLTANNITATNINGMFYSTSAQGTGTSPGACNVIGIFYKGNFINGTTNGPGFDSSRNSTPDNFELNRLITGWQIALPTLKAGGNITLYIPPSLAYGAADVRRQDGSIAIPGNSYLRFTINLVNVQ